MSYFLRQTSLREQNSIYGINKKIKSLFTVIYIQSRKIEICSLFICLMSVKAICSNFGSKKGKESFLNFNCRLSSVLCTEENRRVEKCDVSALSEPRMLNQTKHEVDTLDEAVNLLLVI